MFVNSRHFLKMIVDKIKRTAVQIVRWTVNSINEAKDTNLKKIVPLHPTKVKQKQHKRFLIIVYFSFLEINLTLHKLIVKKQ